MRWSKFHSLGLEHRTGGRGRARRQHQVETWSMERVLSKSEPSQTHMQHLGAVAENELFGRTERSMEAKRRPLPWEQAGKTGRRGREGQMREYQRAGEEGIFAFGAHSPINI